jgi:hypothetical protein
MPTVRDFQDGETSAEPRREVQHSPLVGGIMLNA